MCIRDSLHVVKVERRAINGGSLRMYVRRRAIPREDSWGLMCAWEHGVLGADPVDALDRFGWQTQIIREQLQSAMRILQDHETVCDLYAASTKSSTLLQYCGIDHTQIRYAVERSPEKHGLETTATRIWIISEESWHLNHTAVAMIGAWQFTDAFIRRESAYLASGGGFLVPLPRVRMIYQGRPQPEVAHVR